MIPNAWAGFDFGLGPDVEMLRKTVQGFAQDRIAPRADAIDRDNTFPRDLWPEMGALGLHGITVDEEYGGSGLGYRSEERRCETIWHHRKRNTIRQRNQVRCFQRSIPKGQCL